LGVGVGAPPPKPKSPIPNPQSPITLSYLNEERKLELVKYNKKIQNIININIINYFVENIL